MAKYLKSNTRKPLSKKTAKVFKKQIITKAKLREISQKLIKKVSLNIKSKRGRISCEKLLHCIKKQEYQCSICLELMVYPIMLECGHSFCLDCIENVPLAKLPTKQQRCKCPLCRNVEDLKFCEKNSLIQQRIKFIVQNILSKDEKQQFNAKLQAFNLKISSRGISQDLAVGDNVKIKIYNNWQLAKVNNVITHEKIKLYQLKKLNNEEIYYCHSNSYNIMPYNLRIQERFDNIFDGMDISIESIYSWSIQEPMLHTYIHDTINLFDMSDEEVLDLPYPRLQRVNNIIIERSPQIMQNIIEID